MPQVWTGHTSRPIVAFAFALGALAALSPPTAASTDPEAGTWAWLSAQAVIFGPVGDYRPIGEPPELGGGAHLIVGRVGFPFALRIDFAVTGNQATFTDTTAVLADGEKWPSSVDVEVGNQERWVTIGAQWDPHVSGSGFYAFAGAGVVIVKGRVEVVRSNGEFIDPAKLYITGAPDLPDANVAPCATVGAGLRVTVPKHRNHGFNLEGQLLVGGSVEYTGTPPVLSDLPQTTFPVEHASFSGFSVRIGYTYGK